MRLSRVVTSSALLASLSIPILAQTQPSLNTIIQSDGTVKALYESQPVLTAQVWMFAENWNRITSWQTMGNGSSTFARDGQLNPGILNTSTTYANSGGGTTFTFKATPSRYVTSSSDHVNISLDESFWAGATLSDGSSSTVLNADFLSSFSARSANARTITITRPDGFKATITAPGTVRYVIQDSRYNGFGFELRFDERTGGWASGTSHTYPVTIKYSTSTTTTPDSPVVVNEGSNWVQLPQSLSVQTGSALDWRDTFAQPAGSKGWLSVNSAGKFVFQNDSSKPQRFYGANLAHYACFPSKTEATQLADNLAKMGYNTVRLHHIDYILTEGTSANSTTINPTRLDQINYLIAKLRERGIYVSIDLYSLRSPKSGEVISGVPSFNDYKALLLVSNSARQNWLSYSTNLLNSMNPYTGLRWKEDPAIAWICLVNESTPLWYTGLRYDVKLLLDNAVGGSWDPWSDAGSRAAVNLSRSTSNWMASQMRSLGVKALLSDVNAGFEKVLSVARQDYDYVDNHMYFAHPSSGFGLPLQQRATSPLRQIKEEGWFAASRIQGKPFTVTEFDGVAPNQFRAEFGLMAGAMGVVQHWDGMWRFQWADNMGRALTVGAMGLFSLTGDPLNMATERATVAMFLRGDLTNSDTPYVIGNPANVANSAIFNIHPAVQQSVLARPIAQSVVSGSSPTAYIRDGNSTTNDGSVLTDLNRLTMRVNTPCTAGLIGGEGSTLSSGCLSATFTKSRATIYLSSIDRRPLTSSRRMLLAHLTDVQNSGATFTGQERSTMTDWGHLPHLAKDGAAKVTINVANPSIMRVYRIDLTGRRVAVVPFTRASKSISFDVTTRDPNSNTATIYYEIVTTK